jgi:DNA-binding PadR family transcriptional regulator
VLTNIEAMLLSYLIMLGPSTSYDIIKLLRNSANKAISPETGVVYPAIRNLGKKGCIEGEMVVQTSRPNKTLWTVTDDGRARFREWVEKPVTAEVYRTSRAVFETKCVYAAKAGLDQRRAFVESQRAILVGYQQEILSRSSEMPGPQSVTRLIIDHFLKVLELDLGLLDRIAQLS